MPAPKITLPRTSNLRVDTAAAKDTPRLLLLAALLALYCPNDADRLALCTAGSGATLPCSLMLA